MVLYPDVVSFIDSRFDCCDLLQRNVIHHGAGKPSGIRSWDSCQTRRRQTICLKRWTSVFDGPQQNSNVRVELKALGNAFMVKAIELDIKLQKLAKGSYTAPSPRTGVTTMDKLHFRPTDYSVVVKNRASPPNSWKWVIYRAGRSSPVKQSSAYSSHHGDRQSGRKRCAQAAVGQAPCHG